MMLTAMLVPLGAKVALAPGLYTLDELCAAITRAGAEAVTASASVRNDLYAASLSDISPTDLERALVADRKSVV